MRLLLDTCTFLWFITADRKLPEPLVALLRSADHEAWLSVASAWEVAIKFEAGRLTLPEEPGAYVAAQRERHGFHSLPIREAVLSHLARLPRLHRDPFDRLLICQAIEEELSIVTPDAAVRAYPVRTLWND